MDPRRHDARLSVYPEYRKPGVPRGGEGQNEREREREGGGLEEAYRNTGTGRVRELSERATCRTAWSWLALISSTDEAA